MRRHDAWASWFHMLVLHQHQSVLLLSMLLGLPRRASRRLLLQQVAMLNSGAVRGALRCAMHGGGNDFVDAA